MVLFQVAAARHLLKEYILASGQVAYGSAIKGRMIVSAPRTPGYEANLLSPSSILFNMYQIMIE